MPLFLAVFLSLYGGMHYYWYRKSQPLYQHSTLNKYLLLFFLLIMIFAPITIRFLERWGHETTARGMAIIGYSWMGFLFLSCSCFLLLDLLRLLVWTAERAGTGVNLGNFLPGVGVTFYGVTVLVCLICLYGWYEATAIRTETVDIYTTKIPQAAGTITIAQISDVHLGLLIGERRLKTILAAVRASSPDIVVATGDLVDGQMDGRDGLTGLMGAIQPRLGKFAVTGNHELYVGSGQALSFLRDAGFTVLQGESVDVSGILTIVGVDDPVFGGKDEVVAQERTVLSQASPDRFTLLLKHRPVITKESRGKFDLQLSGHVHQGQIFPFGLLTRIAFPLPTGFSGIEEGGAVYVSRGTGTWGPPIRFLATPEVTVFRIRHP